MKILRIPTFWTAEQADTIYSFLGDLQAAVWQEYHEEIRQMYDEVKEQAKSNANENWEDDIEF